MPMSSRPTSSWVWASASSPRSRCAKKRRAASCWPARPVICSARTSPGSPSSAAPTCATSSTTSSRCSRTGCRARSSSAPCRATRRTTSSSRTGMDRTPAITSRLPEVGTTIFTVMSALAQEHGAVNLGQGFPDFDCDPALIDAVDRAMRAGHNQYPPMTGLPLLRERIAAKIESLYGHRYDAAGEITVTAGATQAILTAILTLVHPGDEVIVLDPCYDSYDPNIVLAGATPVHVPLTPGTFAPDFERLAGAITPRTRAIVINSP